MPSITYRLDKTGFTIIEKMAIRVEDLTAPMKNIGELMLRSISKNFREGGRPVKWKPSHRALGMYRGRQKGKTGLTLVDSARLKKSVSYDARPREVEVGSNVKYAAVHQFGFKGDVHQNVKEHWRRITQAFGKKLSEPMMVDVSAFSRTLHMVIPARPFLLMQDEDMTRSQGILKKFIEEGAA